MTTTLIKSLDEQAHIDPSIFKRFFSSHEQEKIEDEYSPREDAAIGIPGKSCETNLFLGFFFDGTRNNYAKSTQAADRTHSNVARLFDAYPGQTIAPAVMLTSEVLWPDEDRYPNYFRIYVPGVGTPFEEIRDDGHRGKSLTSDGRSGAAFARWGQHRIVWGLAQAINAVHRYFHKRPLLYPGEIRELAESMELNARSLKAGALFVDLGRAANAKAHFKRVLMRLHRAIAPHMPGRNGERPGKIDPGIVRTIYVSTFGFSRGAAAARVFTNWFLALCELDAELARRPGPTLGGFPVTFDFLGIFDTVASVGNAAIIPGAHGHEAWADAEVSLRIPPGVKCTHLVSAHEVRRCFPLDSISVGGTLPAGCKEIVFPGVHSDVGGGYAPTEQGRGTTALGDDVLSRIPLAVMYREARLSGAPLKLERTRQFVRERFLISPALLRTFNAYLAHFPEPGHSLRQIMRSQMQVAILWRRDWAGKMATMESVRRAPQVDHNDIVGADREFVEELHKFEAWRGLAVDTRRIGAYSMGDGVRAAEFERSLGIDPARIDEWREIAPGSAVHHSRASVRGS